MRSSVKALAAVAVLASWAVSPTATGQPSGGTVVFGGATIGTPNATTTLIKQTTNSAIINWQSFSVGSGSSVVFDQPGAAAIALNRVLGGGVSQIDGSLSANGQVWIINANGILFGKGSQVNVAGLLATTSDIANGDFAAGNYNFSSASSNPSASVENAGSVRVGAGGSAVLSAPHVSNTGLIQADGGQIVLGGANAFTVDFDGDNLLRYQISTPVAVTPTDANGTPQKELVGNSGTLSAAGGRILLTARAATNVADNVVNNTGMISANSASVHNGEVILDAGSGSVEDSGAITATGNGIGESGGNVALAGNSVTVADNAVIDASGDQGGGTVSIGGGLHGSGAYQQAQNTDVGNATIHADATTNGNGGTIAIWSTGQTRFAGTATATGGSQSGNGGMVETSGHYLNVTPAAMVNTAAPHGALGDWLLDPVTLTIVASSPTPDPTLVGGVLPYSDPASTITATTIEHVLGNNPGSAGTNVTLQARDDIFVNAAITAIGTGHSLELDAGRSIFVNANINVSGSGSGVTLSANNAGAPATDPGTAGISGAGIITGDTVNLILGTNDANTLGSIGSAGSAINIGGGAVSVHSNGADVFIQNGGTSHNLILASSDAGAGHFTALSSGDLTIAAGAVIASSASGDAVVLSAVGNFINNAGSGALSLTGSGRFLIYSAAPGTDTFGGLNSGNTAIWNSVYPDAVSQGGNRYVFAFQPTLTLTSTDAAKTYGTDDSASLASAYTVAGFDPGIAGVYLADTAATALSGAPSITSAGSSAGASVDGGPYAITIAQGTLTSPAGYAFTFVSSGELTVDPATLTYVATPANRAYGADNPVFSGDVTGFVNGDTLESATNGTLTFTSPATASSNVGSYAINGSGLTANNGNYVFVQAAGNATALTIGAATLTYVADPFARTYGSANPVFTGNVTGFVGDDTLASATTGTLTFTSPATSHSGVGSYAINGSGLTANNGNYVFVQAAGNATALTITQALLSVVANTQTKVYGAKDPKLTYTFDGLVAGDTSAVFTGALTRAAGQNVGNYAITQGTLSAGPNYAISFTGANFSITPATLTYVANNTNRIYGSANPAVSGKITGFVNGDTLASATTGTLTFTTTATQSSNVGSYGVTGSGLSANNGNYVFVQAASNATALTINPATLTYVATSGTIDQGAPIPVLTGMVTGFVNGDTLESATTGTLIFTTAATSSSPPGVYAINGSGLAADHGNYVFVQDPGNATALTINNIGPQNVGLDGWFPWTSGGDRPGDEGSGLWGYDNGGGQVIVVDNGGGASNLPPGDTTTLSGPIAQLAADQGYVEPPTNADRRSSSLSRYFDNGSLFDNNFPNWANDALFWP
jgi:filamentous hemagglutinin family protein